MCMGRGPPPATAAPATPHTPPCGMRLPVSSCRASEKKRKSTVCPVCASYTPPTPAACATTPACTHAHVGAPPARSARRSSTRHSLQPASQPAWCAHVLPPPPPHLLLLLLRHRQCHLLPRAVRRQVQRRRRLGRQRQPPRELVCYRRSSAIPPVHRHLGRPLGGLHRHEGGTAGRGLHRHPAPSGDGARPPSRRAAASRSPARQPHALRARAGGGCSHHPCAGRRDP